MPADVSTLLAGLPDVPGGRIAYREEIRHPAFTDAEVASGVIYRDGARLVREQSMPEAEVATIGASVVSIETPSSGENVLPIPDELQPLFSALRAVMNQDVQDLAERADLTSRPDANTWVLEFPELDPRYGFMTIEGCGFEVRVIEILEASGVRRTMLIGPVE